MTGTDRARQEEYRSDASATVVKEEAMPPDRALLAIDTEAYSSRPGRAQPEVHRDIQDVVNEALMRAGFETKADVLKLDDTGDGVIVTMADKDLPRLLDPLIGELDRELRRRDARGKQRLRLRASIHAGPVDDIEQVGPAKNETARLLHAASVYEALNRYPRAGLALIVSDRAYAVVRHHYTALDPEWFAPVDVHEKEYEALAWVYVPGEGKPQLREASTDGKSPTGDEQTGDAPEGGGTGRRPDRPPVHSGAQFTQYGGGNQFGGDVHGDLNINQPNAGRDVVSGHRGDVRGDVVRGDKHVGYPHRGDKGEPETGDSR